MSRSQYNDTLGAHYVDLRERLYWNKYQYRATVSVPHGSQICSKRITTLEQFLSRMGWYRMSAHTRRKVDSDPTLYERWWQWRSDLPKGVDYTLRSEGGCTAVYTNDLEILKSLSAHFQHSYKLTAVTVASREAGIRYFRSRPRYSRRVYMRGQRLDQAQFCALMNFLDQHEQRLRLSPGLKSASLRCRDYNRTWLSSAYFIDYNDPRVEQVLDLAWGDMLGKRYELRQWGATYLEDSTQCITVDA